MMLVRVACLCLCLRARRRGACRADAMRLRACAAAIVLLHFLVLTGAAAAELDRPGRYAIATARPEATESGTALLEAGGNAFDAAVAVTAALAVTEPFASGLGGGGFFLLHLAAEARDVFVDARETAPGAATRDMYLDAGGQPIEEKSMDGPLAAGIPGIPAALEHLARRYGRLPLATSLGPAVRLAREGFVVSERYRRSATLRLNALQRYETSARTFLVDNGVPPAGHRIVQRDLAETLIRIAERGAAGFYAGATADQLIAAVRAAGGNWTLQDLQNYQVIERAPIRARYQDIDIVSAPPPSAGGIVLSQALNLLARTDLATMKPDARVHNIVEALRRGYHDRARLLGDPDFASIPVAKLISRGYAAEQARTIDSERATRSSELETPTPRGESANTTHFSIIDADGNRVAATLSINYPFGSAFTATGTGVLLNDEMDDFAVKPEAPNAYGLIGYDANSIAPGKRPLSSMTPTFLVSPDRIGILGTPGGSRITSMVLLAVLDFAAGHGPASWVALPRFHHQYLPDKIEYERDALAPSVITALERRGHTLVAVDRRYGDMQAVLWRRASGRLEAASDPRGEGSSRVQQ